MLVALVALQGCQSHAVPRADDDPIGRYLSQRGLAETAPPEAPEPAQRDRNADTVLTAMHFLDLPYRRGGNSADDGFDCSGFTRHIYQVSLGLALPRRVDEQASAPGLLKVGREDLQPGDLVFFNTLRRTFSHVGIYVGEGKFIHAPRTGAHVRMEDMRLAYWNKRFTGARRSAAAGTPVSSAAGELAAPHAAPQAALLPR